MNRLCLSKITCQVFVDRAELFLWADRIWRGPSESDKRAVLKIRGIANVHTVRDLGNGSQNFEQ